MLRWLLRNYSGTCRPHTCPLGEADDQEEWQRDGEVSREDSVYRFYYNSYETRLGQLQAQLEDMKRHGPDFYASQCCEAVHSGRRSQEIVVEIQTLRRELQLCQFKSLRHLYLTETSPSLTKTAPQKKPLQQEPPPLQEDDRNLPDWIIRDMKKEKSMTADQHERLKIKAESCVLTLAGRTLSMPSKESPPDYYKLFRLWDPDRVSCTPDADPHLPESATVVQDRTLSAPDLQKILCNA